MTSPRRSRGGGDPAAGTSGATLRGALLIGVAVVVGVILLGTGFDSDAVTSTGDDPSDQASDNGDDENGEDPGDDETTTTSTPATTHTQGTVRVQVLNGGGPTGSAGTSSTALTAAQFIALEPADTADVPESIVYYNPTFEADAAAVATTLGITTPPQPMPATPPEGAPAASEFDVIVILGPGFTPVG